MEKKKYFKLYKNGKKWCVAAITVFGITTSISLANISDVNADTVPEQTVDAVTRQPQNNSVDEGEKKTVTTVPQSQLADNGSGNIASYNQNDQLQSYTADSIVHQPADEISQKVPENNISTISLNGDFSGISKDNLKVINAQLNLNDGQSINAWGTIKYQGNSSLSLPKKGYRLKLYEDESMTKKLKIEIPGSGFKTNAFNLKANFADANQGNNIVNAEIFKQITVSRPNLAESIVKKMPNYGQIAGIPVRLTINGIQMGTYTLNTYHQDKLFKMDDEKATDIAITGEGYDPVTGFQQPVTLANFISGSTFDNVSPAEVTQATVDRFNELYLVANASEENYLQLEDQYVDLPSAIDYIAFSFAINNIDGLRKNIFYLSKDGGKWTLMPYDLDTSWATLWDGNEMDHQADFSQTLNNSGNKLLINIYNHHQQEVINRYKELRQGTLSTANVISLFNQWFDSIGEKNYQFNDEIWNAYNMDGVAQHPAYLPKQVMFNRINERLKALDQAWGIATPDEVINISETKNVSRTIVLNNPDGTKKNEKQVVAFNRQSQYNTASKQLLVKGNWVSEDPTLPAYQLPMIDGYTTLVNNRLTTAIEALAVNENIPSSVLEVNYVANGFDQNDQSNLAAFDQVQLVNNELHAVGWHVTNQVATHPYHYLIVVDKTNNQELGRVQAAPIYRPDVKQAHNLYNAEYAGFNVTVPLDLNKLTASVDQLAIISRYSDNPTGEGDNIDFFGPMINLDQSNQAYLDSFETSANNTLHLSGWHATNQALTKPYHFIILFDQTTGQEVGRQRVLNGVRTDVQKAFPGINSSILSGFSADFALGGLNLDHNLQAISRYSDSLSGEGNYVDYWFNPVKLMPAKTQNVGYLDRVDVSQGQLQVSGWHATDMTQLEKNHYLILFDQTTNTQIASQKIENVQRRDVAQAYNSITNADWSGFSANFGKLDLVPTHHYSLVSRYSTSSTGNGDSGSYTDYWFKLPERNQQAYSLDSVEMTENGLHLTGWMASDYSVIAPYAYLIVLSNGQEIGRQQVSLTMRADVANAVPTIYNSQQSGFDTLVKLDLAKLADNYQVLLRFTDSADGNGNYHDQLSHEYPTNAGWFDNVSVSDTKVSFAGWHVDDRAVDKPFQYVILLKDGSEVARIKLNSNEQNLTRNDVKQLYPSIYNGKNAGFSGEITSLIDLGNSNIQLIHRFTSSDDGNIDYVDYYSPVIKK